MMSRTESKRALFDRLAEVAKSLGQGRRLEILELVAQGEPAVETVAERLGLSVANASQHLRRLQRAGLVVSRRDRKRVRYRLSNPMIVDLLSALRKIAEQNLAELRAVVGSFVGRRDDLEPVSRAELARRIRSGLVIVLDVRPEDEYAAGHIPGAINMPLGGLARRSGELPKNRKIVAYCRGAYCVLALDAVDLLRRQGLNAQRLEDGYPEWKAAGLPVATGATRFFSAANRGRASGLRRSRPET